MKTKKTVKSVKTDKQTKLTAGPVPPPPPTDPSPLLFHHTTRRTARSGGPSSLTVAAASPLVMASSRTERKLDLGCGQNVKEGYEGVDLYGDHAKHHVDLFKFPWPFADESVDEVHSSHFLEHIPARECEVRDLVLSEKNVGEHDKIMREFVGKDMFFAFMDECYRIMKPDAWMHVVVPSGRSNRAFWDPTHRRFFMQETFLYLAEGWRAINRLDHYRCKCNFGSNVNYSLPGEEGLRAPEVHNERFQHLWNVTVDWIADLKKLKPGEGVQPPPAAP